MEKDYTLTLNQYYLLLLSLGNNFYHPSHGCAGAVHACVHAAKSPASIYPAEKPQSSWDGGEEGRAPQGCTLHSLHRNMKLNYTTPRWGGGGGWGGGNLVLQYKE